VTESDESAPNISETSSSAEVPSQPPQQEENVEVLLGELKKDAQTELSEIKDLYQHTLDKKEYLQKIYTESQDHHGTVMKRLEDEETLLQRKLDRLSTRYASSRRAMHSLEQQIQSTHHRPTLDKLIGQKDSCHMHAEATLSEREEVETLLRMNKQQQQQIDARNNTRVDIMKAICDHYDHMLKCCHQHMVNLDRVRQQASDVLRSGSEL
jgi:chromosome segregation ATPase